MNAAEKLVLACLLGAAACLLVVGGVTGLVIRHIVQVLPLVVAAIFVARRTPSAPFAAAPLFIFWAFLMVAIWLFLLGLTRIVSGHFTPIEIVLTVLIGGFALVGLGATVACRMQARWTNRIAAFLIFALFQFAAFWLSIRPAIRHR